MASIITDDWAADFFRNAEEAFRGFWSTIIEMRHSRLSLLFDGDMARQFRQVTYKCPNGGDLTLPVASHLRQADEFRNERLWIAIDIAPLFQVVPRWT